MVGDGWDGRGMVGMVEGWSGWSKDGRDGRREIRRYRDMNLPPMCESFSVHSPKKSLQVLVFLELLELISLFIAKPMSSCGCGMEGNRKMVPYVSTISTTYLREGGYSLLSLGRCKIYASQTILDTL